MNKYTEWFPPDTKPIRKGIYEIEQQCEGYIWLRYFDGEYWHVGGNTRSMSRCLSVAKMNGEFKERRIVNAHRWRGLTEAAYKELVNER